jgi:excisionase family DNA binding protein
MNQAERIFAEVNGTIERLYTVKEAARALKVTPAWIYRLSAAGLIESIRWRGSAIVFPKSALHDYIRRQAHPKRLAVVKASRSPKE